MSFKNLTYLLIMSTIQQLAYGISASLGPVSKQEINIGNGDDPKTLDPQKCNESTCTIIIRQLFEGLVKADANGNTLPAAAEIWQISKDGKKYTFHLRSNLKWSDNTKVTASDFVFALQRLVDPKVASEQASLLENVVGAKEITSGNKHPTELGVKAINDSTLEITLVQPTPSLLEILKVTNTYPVQQSNIVEFDDHFTDVNKLVSNGAYMLTYRQVGDKVVVEKNPYYWNAEHTYITKVNFYGVVDANSEFRMYATGQLDMTTSIPVDQFKQIKANYASELKVTPYLASYYYIFNNSSPLFKNNIKLRTALNIAIDRDIIANSILGMGQKPLYDMVPYGTKNYTQNKPYWQDWTRPLQLAEARKLYQEAGYSREKPFTVHILYNTSDAHRKIATAIASMWKKTLGVNAITENEEWKTMLDKRTNGDFEILRMGGIANINDPYDFFSALRSTDPGNDAKYKNPKYDALVNQASKETDPQKRKLLMQQAGKELVNDVPIAPVYSYVTSYLIKPYVMNIKKDAMNNYNLSGVTIKR